MHHRFPWPVEQASCAGLCGASLDDNLSTSLFTLAVMTRRLLPLLALAAQTACSPGLAGAPHTEAGALAHDRTVIEQSDMTSLQAANLYEAVAKLHPEWIRGRQTNRVSRDRDGQILAGQSELFIDGQRQGSIELMKTMRVYDVALIKFYSASEAQAKFGMGNMTTVIAITTAK